MITIILSAVSLLAAIVTIAVGLTVISRYNIDRRLRAVEEGKMYAEIAQLRKDLDAAHCKIDILDKAARAVDVDIAEIKKDVGHILAAIERIERKLEEP